ncbi:MAG: nitrogenase component 1 [Oscillospiraceae bacterium]|nr:nitrogenase component 1 [Oscillospiraceae bacterium]
MSLIRTLPVPSDRMAALWTMLGVEDAVVLEYGPLGTTRYAGRQWEGMGLRTRRLFSTHLGEDDVVMGDVTRLETALRALDSALQPPVIFVVPSAILAVTGADIAGVCSYMQAEVHATLIPYEGGGLKGDYATGLHDVYALLVRELTETDAPVLPGTYNILGASAGSYRIRSDLWEMEELMRAAFGASRIATLGLDSTVADLRAAGGAAVNLVIRPEALSAARWLQAHCGTPYVAMAPYGYTGTVRWLEAVGQTLGLPDADVIHGIQGKFEAARLGLQRRRGAQPTVSIAGEYHLVAGLRDFARSLDLPTDVLICRHALGHVEDADAEIRYYHQERDWMTVLRALHGQHVLADDVALSVCPEDNHKLCVSVPVAGRPQIAQHLPIMGPRGADFLMEFLEQM